MVLADFKKITHIKTQMKNYFFCLLITLLGVSSTMAQDAYQKSEKKFLPEKCHGSRGGKAVEYVMLHFCSNAVKKPTNPYVLEDVLGVFRTYGVSAHYIIDRSGKIYQLVDEKRSAYHAGKGKLPDSPHHENALNSRSIGIEILGIGSQTDMKMFMSTTHYAKIPEELRGFTDAQYKALNELLDDLLKRYPKIKKDRQHIVGHDEYAPGRRSDPGELFDWNKIGLTEK